MGDRLKDKVAVVTGAGRGVGRGEALALAEEGAKVVVNDNGCARDGTGTDHGPADEVVAEIKAKGGTAVANYDTVATVEGANNIIKTAVDNFGRIDIKSDRWYKHNTMNKQLNKEMVVLISRYSRQRASSFIRARDGSFAKLLRNKCTATANISLREMNHEEKKNQIPLDNNNRNWNYCDRDFMSTEEGFYEADS